MNRRTLLAGVAGAAGACSAAGARYARASEETAGTTLVTQLTTAPFPHPSRAAGHVYEKRHYDAAGHYSDASVAFYIPPGYRAGAAASLIVHFHGWRNDVAEVLRRYRLREQLAASGRNAILIVPQGPKDAPDSGDGKLELDDGGFARFIDEAMAYLRTQNVTTATLPERIVLTAHSGGYGGAGGVLLRGGMNRFICDVVLFDAAYGYFDAFTDWVKASPEHHLLSLFTDDTSTGNATLMALVQAPRPNLFVRDADAMTLADLQTRAPTFALTTRVAHDDLMQKYGWYGLFLQATALEAR